MRVSSTSVADLPLAEQFVQFSAAHLESARVLCQRMIDFPGEQTWPRAAVCMAEARQAAEAFLKAAILKKQPATKPGVHDLATLNRRYRELYPETAFRIGLSTRADLLPMWRSAELPNRVVQTRLHRL
jgi:hypothetical protein